MRNKLPRKMSELILVGLRDLAKVERNTTVYKVNMGVWHTPNSHCTVCLAGAVMAKSLDVEPWEELSPGGLIRSALTGKPRASGQDVLALQALNCLRQGGVGQAAATMGLSSRRVDKAVSFDCMIVNYWRDEPKPFHSDMRNLAKRLAKAGL